MADEEWVEGETGAHDYELLGDGAILPGGLTGRTVEMKLWREDGTAVDTSGDTVITDPVNCIVRFTPDAEDIKASNAPMLRRFLITGGPEGAKYHPNGNADVLTVRKP